MKGSKCCSADEEYIKSRGNKRNPYKTTKDKSPEHIQQMIFLLMNVAHYVLKDV